jgi:hypothetical protein
MRVLQARHFSSCDITCERTKCIFTLFLLVIPGLATAQLVYDWSYQEMFEKADVVAIARPLSTSDTKERTIQSGDFHVIGVNTQFEIDLVVKGRKEIKNLVVHHYRHEEHKVAILNAPQVVVFNASPRDMYLMFLVKESDGRYAPVSGQSDPSRAFVILKSPEVAP